MRGVRCLLASSSVASTTAKLALQAVARRLSKDIRTLLTQSTRHDPCTRARPGVVQPPATRWTTPACHVHPRADRTAWWCRPRGVQWPGASVGIPVRPPSSRHTRSHHPTPHAINVPRCHEAWVGRIDWWGGGTARRVTTPARRRWSTRRCGVENPNPNCGTGSRGRASTIKHSYGSGIRPSMRPEASPRRSDLSTTFRCVP